MKIKHILSFFLCFALTIAGGCSFFNSKVSKKETYLAQVSFLVDDCTYELIYFNENSRRIETPKKTSEKVFPGDRIINCFYKNKKVDIEIENANVIKVFKEVPPGSSSCEYKLYTNEKQASIKINENCKYVINEDKSITPLSSIEIGTFLYMFYRQEENEITLEPSYIINPYALYSYPCKPLTSN